MSSKEFKKFPTQFQNVEDESCGPMCLVNALSFLGENMSLNDVLRGLEVSKDETTLPTQLAYYLKSNYPSLDLMVWSDSPFVTPDGIGSTEKEVAENLRKRITKYKRDRDLGKKHAEISFLENSEYLLKYLDAGGKLHCGTITTATIDNLIEQGFLILAACTNSKLWGKLKVLREQKFDIVDGNAEGHFVILYGHSENQYWVSDPYPTGIPERTSNYELDKSEFLAALYWSLQLVAFKKSSNN